MRFNFAREMHELAKKLSFILMCEHKVHMFKISLKPQM